MNEWALAGVKAVDFFFSHVAFGSLVFWLFVLPRGGVVREAEVWWPRVRRLFFFATAASLFWLAACARDMAESWQPSEILKALLYTHFSRIWIGRIALLACCAVFGRRLLRNRSAKLVLLLFGFGALWLASLIGHAAAAAELAAVRVAADLVHSLMIAVWSGGLLSLFDFLGAFGGETPAGTRHAVVRAFSHVAIASVALIAATGVFLGYAGGVRLDDILEDDYSRLVAGKVGAFALALAAAGINQFFHLRRFSHETEDRFARSVRREVAVELLLVVLVFGLAAFLTRTDLPVAAMSIF